MACLTRRVIFRHRPNHFSVSSERVTQQFLASWIPFYWLGKCFGLALLFLPEGNISSVVFQRVVVWGMDRAHHILNSLVVPNVVEFVVSLPWRVLLVLFPTLPPPASPGAGLKPIGGEKGNGRGLASRLEHLKQNSPRRVAGGAGGQESSFTPPLQPQTSPRTPPGKEQRLAVPKKLDDTVVVNGGTGRVSDVSDNSTLPVAERFNDGEATKGVVVATPAIAEVDGRVDATDNKPEGGGRGGGERRRSFGEILRSAFTGNSNVRLRDHLFDLNTASPAPPVPHTPDRQRTPAEAAASLKRQPEHERPNSRPTDVLPAVSKDNGTRRRGQSEARAVEGADLSPAETKSRHATRRRPSEFSRSGSGSGAGGGGAEGRGRSGDGTGRGVRRRSVPGARRAPEDIHKPRPTTAAGSSTASGSKAAVGVVADSREKRLSEWRRRRAEQVDGQQRERPRRSRPAGADVAPGPAAAAGRHRNGAAAGAGGGGGRVSSERRFRHVERFRSDMARAAGSSQEVDDALRTRLSVTSPKTAANGRAR